MQRHHIVCAATALLAAAALVPTRAAGHAFLDHAEPRVGSALAGSPSEVTLTFTEPVEADFSRIEVLDGQAHPVATGSLSHPSPTQLRVPLPPLPPGAYTVHWTVTSVDSHQTDGRFRFTVEARAP